MSRPVAAVLALALLLTFPTGARARLGGLVKKAKDKVAMQMQPLQVQIQARAESTCASQKPGAAAPTPVQQAIQTAPVVPPEEAGAKAAGLTKVDYGQAKELIYTYLGYGRRAGLTDSEKRAVDPKRDQLKDGFKLIGMQ